MKPESKEHHPSFRETSTYTPFGKKDINTGNLSQKGAILPSTLVRALRTLARRKDEK
jgi:hypothetical protein